MEYVPSAARDSLHQQPATGLMEDTSSQIEIHNSSRDAGFICHNKREFFPIFVYVFFFLPQSCREGLHYGLLYSRERERLLLGSFEMSVLERERERGQLERWSISTHKTIE